ncbi:MAG: hypothetical protein QXV64_00580 [Candidatus Anstonellaceae archaeon]
MNKLNFKTMLIYFEKKEKEQDKLIQLSRILIKKSSNAIKLIHLGKFAQAKKELNFLSKQIKKLSNFSKEWKYLILPIEQEYVEAVLLFCSLNTKKFPSYKKLNVSVEAYILGILDLFGELKREIIISLSKNNLSLANELFSLMSNLFDELLLFRFSNSILPNFKKKFDVARIQLETARIELLHHMQVKK